MTAPFAETHLLQNIATGFLRQIQVDDRQTGALLRWLDIKRANLFYGPLAVGDNQKLPIDAMLLKGLADQRGIRGIILDKQD